MAKITSELEEKMLWLKSRGYTIADIAKECGVHFNTVCRHTKGKYFQSKKNVAIYNSDFQMRESIFSYNGVDFIVDYENKTISFGGSILGIEEFTRDNIDTVKNYAESLLYIADSFESLVQE